MEKDHLTEEEKDPLRIILEDFNSKLDIIIECNNALGRKLDSFCEEIREDTANRLAQFLESQGIDAVPAQFRHLVKEG